jgi:hypothetical protein
MKIALPNRDDIIQGILRGVDRIKPELWEIKIGTSISNLKNMYLGLTDDEIEDLLSRIKREKEKNEER